MNTHDNKQPSAQHSSQGQLEVQVNDEPVQLTDSTPTGRQVLAAASLRPEIEFALLRWPSASPTHVIGLDEVTPIPEKGPILKFFAVRSDRVLYFTLDDERYAWAGPLDVEIVRRIGRVPAHQEVWLERRDEPDVLLEHGQQVHLDCDGVERLYTRKTIWRLDVQGESTEWNHRDVAVRDALVKAGIDLAKQWTIVLKVKGESPRQVELNDVIDLNQPGIERLWLRPRQVDNGDGLEFRREFALLPNDETFLETLTYNWEAIMDGARRWLIIHGYVVPVGYNVPSCNLALEIPQTYPAAQLDMFYCDPPLALDNGTCPAATDVRQDISGVSFQRWSRHRNSAHQWSPAHDNVSTHLGLVDEALGREVRA